MIQRGTLIRNIWDRNKITENNLSNEEQKTNLNISKLNQANKIVSSLRQNQIFTVDFAILDELLIGNNQYYYKQWKIKVFTSDTLAETLYMLNLIGPNLVYNISYSEAVNNVLAYYNIGNELKQISFFTIEGNDIYFNAAVYISKTFDGAVITNPLVKLEVVISPFLTIR